MNISSTVLFTLWAQATVIVYCHLPNKRGGNEEHWKNSLESQIVQLLSQVLDTTTIIIIACEYIAARNININNLITDVACVMS
jgi:hypothetical protein